MELLSISQRRTRARRLIEEALARVEASGPAKERSRMPTLIFLFAAAVALLFVGIASSASALPAGTGVGGRVTGFTMAQGGTTPNISNNLRSYEQETCEGGTSSAGDVSFGGSVRFTQSATGSGQSYETTVSVPEPAAWLVLACGLLGLSALAGPWRHRLGADNEVANLNRYGYHFGYTE